MNIKYYMSANQLMIELDSILTELTRAAKLNSDIVHFQVYHAAQTRFNDEELHGHDCGMNFCSLAHYECYMNHWLYDLLGEVHLNHDISKATWEKLINYELTATEKRFDMPFWRILLNWRQCQVDSRFFYKFKVRSRYKEYVGKELPAAMPCSCR